MEGKKYIAIDNGQTIELSSIPILSAGVFQTLTSELLSDPQMHCVNYYGYRHQGDLNLVMCLANDNTHKIYVYGHKVSESSDEWLLAMTKENFAMHLFEREIHENFGTPIKWHPWLKPVRYPKDRHDQSAKVVDYPFFSIESEELHEVGVGPIHAGVIEPGHFRFLCNGEMVLHLEIQLGWQHRGIEPLMLSKDTLLKRTLLAESIAGDTAIGHTLAFAQLMESLSGTRVSKRIDVERSIALDLERIAVHVGDLSALCTDVAYQFGSAVYGALRTPIINFMQAWCGNRFGKGLVRTGGSHYALSSELIGKLLGVLIAFEKQFDDISEKTFGLSSVIQRFENIGQLTKKQIELIGGVGMVARMAGIPRNIRKSHPFAAFEGVDHDQFDQEDATGDVWARATIRRDEITESILNIRHFIQLLSLLKDADNNSRPPKQSIEMAKNSFVISLTEGWRGEICHCAITDEHGQLVHYKIKDPSTHNWMALALALRDLEISDFPVNNKSFDLSYCGHDL